MKWTKKATPKLEVNPLIVAYLDGIKMPDELFLMRPFSQLLIKGMALKLVCFLGREQRTTFMSPSLSTTWWRPYIRILLLWTQTPRG